MKKVLLLIMILSSFITIKAYENDYFSLDIPDGYKISKEENGTYKWDYNNNYIAISLNDNTQNKYNIKYFSQEEIDKQKYYIEDMINEKLSSYNIKATVTSIERKNIDDLYFLEYNLYLPSKASTGYDTHQRGRIYSLNKYLITIIYNTDKEIAEDEYSSLINTFKIKDISIDTRIKNIIIIAIVLGVVLGIIGYFVSSKKKKH